MIKIFRKLTNFWSEPNASASENPSDTLTKAASWQTFDSNIVSDPAYRDAFNSGVPPMQYARKVIRTPSPPIAPNSALSGYLFSRVKDTNGPAYINNIPPPQVPLFGTPTVRGSHHSSGNTSIRSDGVDMRDANNSPLTPPTTPPDENDRQPSSSKSTQHNERAVTLEDDTTEGMPNNADIPESLDGNNRTQLQPQRQQDRQKRSTTPQSKPNWVNEIVIEEDTPENDLPVNYLGTFRGSRHFVPEYTGMLPCSYSCSNQHLLLCGHWIDSPEPCGSNCRKQDHDQKPFNCPTCREIVHTILTGSFPTAEATRLRNLREKKHDMAFVACCVEQVTRAAPQLRTGITEAVVGYVLTDYGRTCERTDNPDSAVCDSIEEIVRDMQKRHERNQRKRLGQENPMNTYEKRKSYEDATSTSANASNFANDVSAARDEQSQETFSPGADKNQDVASVNNKKQKTKLESHREPVTPRNRGTKRSSPSSSSSDEKTSPFAFVPGCKPTRTPVKRVYISPSPTFGEASFLSPPAGVVGTIMRKRRHDIDVDDEDDVQMGGLKKCRTENWRASQEEATRNMPGFARFAAMCNQDKHDL